MTDVDDYNPDNPDEYWPGEWVSRDAIEPNDWNPNELEDDEFEQLVKSIKDNGWTMPIVVHADEDYIIDGEHRWMAADRLPDNPDLTPPDTPSDHVPIYRISVDEAQAKMATVQHNRARGETDIGRLQDYLADLQDRGVLSHVHDRIGYDEDDADELLGTIETPDLPDETMPWEEDDEDDEDEDETVDLPDLHEHRTVALRDDPDTETLQNSERLNEVLSESEFETMAEALGAEIRAQSLVNLAKYVRDTGSVDKLSKYVHGR